MRFARQPRFARGLFAPWHMAPFASAVRVMVDREACWLWWRRWWWRGGVRTAPTVGARTHDHKAKGLALYRLRLCNRALLARLHACVGNARLRRTCTMRDRGAPTINTCRAPRMCVLRAHRCGVAMHALRAPTSLRTWVIRPVAHGAIRVRRARNGGKGGVLVVVAAVVVARRWKNRTHRGARTHDHNVKGPALYRLS